jgi:hypothetical protein
MVFLSKRLNITLHVSFQYTPHRKGSLTGHPRGHRTWGLLKQACLTTRYRTSYTDKSNQPSIHYTKTSQHPRTNPTTSAATSMPQTTNPRHAQAKSATACTLNPATGGGHACAGDRQPWSAERHCRKAPQQRTLQGAGTRKRQSRGVPRCVSCREHAPATAAGGATSPAAGLRMLMPMVGQVLKLLFCWLPSFACS